MYLLGRRSKEYIFTSHDLSENPYNSPNLQLSIRTLTRVRSASFDVETQDLKNI